MKILFSIVLFLSMINIVAAQCDLNPTVTPAAPVLCPNGTDTLWTEVYETYQWYKGNAAIPGATNQFHVVTENDIVKKFKVEVTEDTCIAMSPSVLVDGYVFLLPYVIQTGDQGYYDPQLDAMILCAGDTMLLTMGLPYNTNVQWFDGTDPIPGATVVDYYVTENGSYTACGAPDICPDYNSCLGLYINVIFGGEPVSITLQNDTLYSSTAESYQWNLNGSPIPGATNDWYVPVANGSYTVVSVDEYGCTSESQPYDFIGTNVEESGTISFEIYPNPVQDFFQLQFPATSIHALYIYDLMGNVVYHREADDLSSNIEVDTRLWPGGIYAISIQTIHGNATRMMVKQ